MLLVVPPSTGLVLSRCGLLTYYFLSSLYVTSLSTGLNTDSMLLHCITTTTVVSFILFCINLSLTTMGLLLDL